jgi:hypothetical protein
MPILDHPAQIRLQPWIALFSTMDKQWDSHVCCLLWPLQVSSYDLASSKLQLERAACEPHDGSAISSEHNANPTL